MDVLELERAPLSEESRAKRMKAATQAAHERIDRQIMAADPFASRENFGRFVRLQYRIHHAVDPLFRSPALAALLPESGGPPTAGPRGTGRRRSRRQPPRAAGKRRTPRPMSPPLSAGSMWWRLEPRRAFLLKAAAKLNLNEDFGARHLAGHPAGRGLHWRTFTAALDAVPLSEADEAAPLQAPKPPLPWSPTGSRSSSPDPTVPRHGAAPLSRARGSRGRRPAGRPPGCAAGRGDQATWSSPCRTPPVPRA